MLIAAMKHRYLLKHPKLRVIIAGLPQDSDGTAIKRFEKVEKSNQTFIVHELYILYSTQIINSVHILWINIEVSYRYVLLDKYLLYLRIYNIIRTKRLCVNDCEFFPRCYESTIQNEFYISLFETRLYSTLTRKIVFRKIKIKHYKNQTILHSTQNLKCMKSVLYSCLFKL